MKRRRKEPGRITGINWSIGRDGTSKVEDSVLYGHVTDLFVKE
jgi:hypothetical protein